MNFACKINLEFRQTITERNENVCMIAKKNKSLNFHSVEKIFHDDILSKNLTKWELAEKAKL